MESPYTRAELQSMPIDELTTLMNEKSSRLYPFCFIGLNVNLAKEILKQKEYNNIVLLISDKDGSLMDVNKSYYFCDIDKSNIIINIWPAF
jgi:hypothetical protein